MVCSLCCFGVVIDVGFTGFVRRYFPMQFHPIEVLTIQVYVSTSLTAHRQPH